MIIYTEIIGYILICFIILVLIINKNWKNKDINSGLAVIYIVNFLLIHWFAALLYLLPWHRYINGKWMFYGLREATYGAGTFAVGNLILGPMFIRMFFLPRKDRDGAGKTKQDFSSPLPKKYFLFGVASYLILPHFLAGLPTVTSLIAAGQQLMVVGVCLICWQAWNEGNKRKFKRWLFLTFTFPLLSIVLVGFLATGISMVLVILFFVARFFKPKWKVFILGSFVVYIGISLYLTYMRDREEIRAAAWSGGSIFTTAKILKTSITHPAWFNIFDLEQLERIDERMNQNILVGAAVDYINLGSVDYAHGRTVLDAFAALIPRALWKEKPMLAGSSGDLITSYTGIPFASETSVGMGQVMEFYINFGRMGIIVGFLVLGIIIAIIDILAGYHLGECNLKKFTLWFLPGLAFVNVGGAFAELTATIGAAIFLVYLITSRNLLIALFALLILFFLMQVMKGLALRFLPF